MSNDAIRTSDSRAVAILLFSVLVVSACTILYELLISTASSYFLGSSVLHFSLTIGLFMFFLGVGSYLSRFFNERLLDLFVTIEIAIGLVGGLSALILYASFSVTDHYYVAAFLVTALLSTLAGLEIPIVTRVLREYQSLSDALAHIMSFDYVGALISSVLFPIVLLPYLGLVQTGCVVGSLNLAVALVVVQAFRGKLSNVPARRWICLLGIVGLLSIGFYSGRVTGFFEQFIYDDQIVFSRQTPYQKIVLTHHNNDVRLYLNGELQFSAIDEYRYHEPLVHVPMIAAESHADVLLLGAGDGLAAREILKHRGVRSVVIVDLDRGVTELARNFPAIVRLNHNVLSDSRVTVINADAWNFVAKEQGQFDVIIADLPDPNDVPLGKLYSREFYGLVGHRLKPNGVFVTQATSNFFARRAFSSIAVTLQEVFPYVSPYGTYVPAFGPWGFILAAHQPVQPKWERLPPGLRFLTPESGRNLFSLPEDGSVVPVDSNRLDRLAILQYYSEDWGKFH
jgi:spermidine synthase